MITRRPSYPVGTKAPKKSQDRPPLDPITDPKKRTLLQLGAVLGTVLQKRWQPPQYAFYNISLQNVPTTAY